MRRPAWGPIFRAYSTRSRASTPRSRKSPSTLDSQAHGLALGFAEAAVTVTIETRQQLLPVLLCLFAAGFPGFPRLAPFGFVQLAVTILVKSLEHRLAHGALRSESRCAGAAEGASAVRTVVHHPMMHPAVHFPHGLPARHTALFGVPTEAKVGFACVALAD